MAYFDNAATTYPKPESVYKSMDEFYRASGANAGRGNYGLASNANRVIDETRMLVKQVLQCPSKQVIFTPTATIALNMIIQGMIEAGAVQIYISPFEHNAVTRVLNAYEETGRIKVTQLCVTNTLKFDLERIRYQFEADRPDMVIISHASNVFGLVAPVEEIFKLSKEHNAVTIVDMSQTAGIVESNIGLSCFDFAVFAGHKTMYGPTGISGFVMKPEIKLPPVLYGGTGIESANQNMPDGLPERYEMGTLNISGIAGLNAALKWILETGMQNLADTEKLHRNRLLSILQEYRWIKPVGIYQDNEYVGIVSCIIDGMSSDSAGSIFSEKGIAVRTGLQCAPLAHQFMRTFPAGTIRFSVGFFTSDTDYEELESALDYIDAEIG